MRLKGNQTATFSGVIRHMSQSEMMGMVPDAELERIRKKDQRPMLKVFTIGHEGVATGRIVGWGRASVRYFKDTIRDLARRTRVGIPVYENHDGDGAGDRRRIGEVVGTTLKKINNRLHALAAIWIYPEFVSRRLDVASIEADVEIEADGERAATVTDIQAVTGVALSDSAVATPGFPEATLRGAFHALNELSSDDQPVSDTPPREAIEGPPEPGLLAEALSQRDLTPLQRKFIERRAHPPAETGATGNPGLQAAEAFVDRELRAFEGLHDFFREAFAQEPIACSLPTGDRALNGTDISHPMNNPMIPR